MSKTKQITFSGGYGAFQLTSAEMGSAKAVSIKKILFTTVGAGTLAIQVGFNSAAIAAGSVVPVSGVTSTGTIPATTRIVPGTVILTDDQVGPVVWTDEGDGTLTPSGTGGTEDGISGTIDYNTGAVSLLYTGDPGITALDYNAYSNYIYAALATAPAAANPSIILNERYDLMGRGEVLVFVAPVGTPYAHVTYTPTEIV